VEDVVALMLLAERFKVDPLKKYLAPILEKLVSVETVWPTLKAAIDLPDLAAACKKVLF